MKLKQLRICVVLAAVLLMSLASPFTVMADHEDTDLMEIRVSMKLGSTQAAINDNTYTLDQPPIVVNGRSMVPLRFFSESLGAKVTWNAKERSVLVKTIDVTAKLYVNNKLATVNGVDITLDAPPVIHNHRTLVPVKFVSETLGYRVDWLEKSKTIVISGLAPTSGTLVANLLAENTAAQSPGNTEISVPAPVLGTSPASSHSAMELDVIRLVNVEREKEGLHPLKLSESLMVVAEAKSQDMVDQRYFSHTSPVYGGMRDLFNAFDVNYRWAGENIATGQRTAEAVMKAWMDSPGHRANILHPNFNQIGVGAVNGGQYGGVTWTQSFTD